MSFANSAGGPARSLQHGLVILTGRFTGGGAAADMTVVSNTGRGITSVAYNAATGAYRITLDGYAGTYQGMNAFVKCNTGSTANQKVVCQAGALDATNRTIDIFITDVATPTAADLATTEELHLQIFFAEHDG